MKNAVSNEIKKNGGAVVRQSIPVYNSLQDEMNRLFDNFQKGLGFDFGAANKWLEPLSDFHAKVDTKETDKEIIVSAELPGVDAKDIELSLTANGLCIRGEKRAEKEESEKGYYRMERSFGSFHRLLPLPCEVDKDNIAAAYKNGILKITLPKTRESLKAEQKITIKAD